MKQQSTIEKKIDGLSFSLSHQLSSDVIDHLVSLPELLDKNRKQKNKLFISISSISVVFLLCFNIFLFQNQNQQENDNSFSSYYSNFNEINIYENE
tara:strand:- start:728 stop:1015 length:288 start_codon:yes stop_codon:yes gene_type:complete